MNTESSQVIQNLDEKMYCYGVIQAAIYPNQVVKIAQGYIVNYLNSETPIQENIQSFC